MIALSACRVGAGGRADAGPAGLARDQFVEVVAGAECRRVAEQAPYGDTDRFRDQALAKLGRNRDDFDVSLPRWEKDADAKKMIDLRVESCYKAASFTSRRGTDGTLTFEKAGD